MTIKNFLNKDDMDLLDYISQGMSNKEIAAIYGVNEMHVKRWVSDLMNRTESVNRVVLAVKYILAK